MNDPRKSADDIAFERELAEASRAYRAADQAGAEAGPPPAMDEAIRAAARRAVQAGPRPVDKPWLLRFSKPLSVAAVLVLTASLVIVMKQEAPDFEPPVPDKVAKIALPKEAMQAEVLEEKAPPAAPPASVAPAKPAPEVPAFTAGKPAADTSLRSAAGDARVTGNVAASPPQVAGTLAVAPPAYAPTLPMPSAPAPAPAPAAAPPAPAAYAKAREAVQAAAVPEITIAAERREAAAAAPVALAKQESAAEKPAAAPALQAKLAAGASNAAALRNKADSGPATTGAPAPARAVALAPAAPAPAPVVVVPLPPGSSVAKEIARMADAARDNEAPEAWLKRIVELRRQQKTKEADEEFARFRKRHPTYVIPAELKAAAGGD